MQNIMAFQVVLNLWVALQQRRNTDLHILSAICIILSILSFQPGDLRWCSIKIMFLYLLHCFSTSIPSESRGKFLIWFKGDLIEWHGS